MKLISKLLLPLSLLGMLNASALEVTVTITGIRNAKGKVGVLAFPTKDGFPDKQDKAIAKATTDAKQGTVTLTLKNLPVGKLALAVLHDEDGNGKLTRTIIGLPLEGVGMSGKPEGKLPPTFNDAVETFEKSRKVTIPLRYLGPAPR